MNTTRNSFEGNVDKTLGKTKGMADKAQGSGHQILGKLQEKVQEGSHTLGDGIEKLGKKLQEKGYSKTGTVVEKAGDKIEHIAD